MSLNLQKLKPENIDDALALFRIQYINEKNHCTSLPHEDNLPWSIFKSSLSGKVEKNPSAALYSEGKLKAFMVSGGFFPFKNQKAVIVPEYAHGISTEMSFQDKDMIYREMYRVLAEQWIKADSQLHIIGHLAHDKDLKEILFQLGYGAILAERIRDLSPLTEKQNTGIEKTHDKEDLIDIWTEHNGYYNDSPIFVTKSQERKDVLECINKCFDTGDQVFTYREESDIRGFMTVGESSIDEEGFLLQHTNSSELKVAYLQERCRGKNAGVNLLNQAIGWAKEAGFERMMVEHETANGPGARFWSRYFEPYMYFSMRYVEKS